MGLRAVLLIINVYPHSAVMSLRLGCRLYTYQLQPGGCPAQNRETEVSVYDRLPLDRYCSGII